MRKLVEYKNGNTTVTLYKNGTRVLETEDQDFNFEFPLNNDVIISHKCDGGCPYCYMDCTPSGKHADIMSPKFLDTVLPGTEMSINLNDLSHPQLIPFMERMKGRGIFLNGTINQIHFMKYHDLLKKLTDRQLLWGIGISLHQPSYEFIKRVKQFPNAVIHVINGIMSDTDIEMLRDNNLKILILGYKDVGRGSEWIRDHNVIIKLRQRYLHDVLDTLPNHFAAVGFDNLAIEQLDARRLFTDEEWEEFYQGDEGSATFAIDLVTKKFDRNSLELSDQSYDLLDNIKTMYEVIKHA